MIRSLTLLLLLSTMFSLPAYSSPKVEGSGEVEVQSGSTASPEEIYKAKTAALMSAVDKCSAEFQTETVRRSSPWALASSQRKVKKCGQTEREGKVICDLYTLTIFSASADYHCLSGPKPEFR